MSRFVSYDWDLHTSYICDDDIDDVKNMKTHEEASDGNFICQSVLGGFVVYDNWDEFDSWNNQI